MMPAQLAALLLPLLPVSNGDPDPELAVVYQSSAIEFHVSGPQSSFLAAVILSLDSSQCHYFQGLPPLLCTYEVLTVGAAEKTFVASTPEYLLPPGIPIYAQGVVAASDAISSTSVESFVVDASKPYPEK